jgi:hypothetical protein
MGVIIAKKLVALGASLRDIEEADSGPFPEKCVMVTKMLISDLVGDGMIAINTAYSALISSMCMCTALLPVVGNDHGSEIAENYFGMN